MIITTQEFHQRHGQLSYDTKKEAIEELDVKTLIAEAKEEAPYRNHSYMFKQNQDFSKLSAQEKDGIAKKHPRIKTEQRRMDYIEEEMEKGTYEPVQILKHHKHHSFIFIANGFHRIFLAKKLKWKTVKCSVKYVDYKLSKTISLGELKTLLDMLEKLFAGEKAKIGKKKVDTTTLLGLKDFLTHVIKKKPHLADSMTIGYSKIKLQNKEKRITK